MEQKKMVCFVISIVFFLVLCACQSGSLASSDSINWHSYNDGMVLGKNEDKKIFLHFYANWCRYCVKMEKETFHNPALVAYINEYFISIKVDTDKANTDQQKKIMAGYNVSGLPSTWFIDENGEKISNLPGFIPPSKLLLVLEFIHTNSFKKMTFKQFSSKKAN